MENITIISYSKLFLELFAVRLKNQWVLAERHFPIIGTVYNSDSRRMILALVQYTHVSACPGTVHCSNTDNLMMVPKSTYYIPCVSVCPGTPGVCVSCMYVFESAQ